MMDSEPTTEITIYDEFGHWIILDVCEPVTITAKEGFGRSQSFTSYLIRIETNHYGFVKPVSAVRRRYSEFCWLRAMLQKRYPNVQLPPLPPKKYLNMVRFTPRIIEIRRAGLAQFLEILLASPMFIRDSVLHLFIQTDLSMGEMEEKLNERLTFSVDSHGSDLGRRDQIYRAMPRTNSVSASHNITCGNESATAGVPSTNASTTNPAPQFVRSYSLASSGSDSAGTTSGEVPSINSSAGTDQSSTTFFRKSRLMPEAVSQLLMFNCPS